jgi:hypothetical protein
MSGRKSGWFHGAIGGALGLALVVLPAGVARADDSDGDSIEDGKDNCPSTATGSATFATTVRTSSISPFQVMGS